MLRLLCARTGREETGFSGIDEVRQELQRERGRRSADGLGVDYKDRPWSLTWEKRKGNQETLMGEMVVGAKDWLLHVVQAYCRMAIKAKKVWCRMLRMEI